jgi:class 3 adenylate cyclase
MASYLSVVDGVRSAIQMQRAFAETAERQKLPLRVRIGISAGEPVTERDDLFGAAVQLGARLCASAEPGSILVSGAVRDLSHGKGFTFRDHGQITLKGFEEPIQAFEVDWKSDQLTG